MKSCTNLEQSKKLAEILPIESADYHYIVQGEKSYFYPYFLSNDAVKDYDEEIKYIPCWSLAALLDNIPQVKLDSTKQYDKKLWRCCAYFASNWHDSDWYDNPVDACYEMILKLNELKML